MPHVSLVADPRLIGWEIREGYVLVSDPEVPAKPTGVDEHLVGALVVIVSE